MKASGYEKYDLCPEWRVYFTYNEIWADLPHAQTRMKDWIAKNIAGAEGERWRFSSYSISPYMAFLSEEDALMCFLAFQ